MEIQALGLIEIKGFLGAIAASDAALKTADVKLINAEKIRGGLTTIHLSGDVAAVTVAVEAGAAAARGLGCLLSSHVIPRLSSDAAQMVVDSISHNELVVMYELNVEPTNSRLPIVEEPALEVNQETSEGGKQPIEKLAPRKKSESKKKK